MTKVEVLVGVAIVVLFVGLFVAGVSKIRSSADEMKCRNNLHQLGLAVHNYEVTYGRVPPLADQGEGASRGQGLPSVFALLTNYLESDPWNYTERRTPAEYYSHSSVAFTFEAKGHTITEHGGIANQTYR